MPKPTLKAPQKPVEEQLTDSFPLFLSLVWKSLDLPSPTRAQLAIAQYLQNGPKRLQIQAFRGLGKSWIAAAFVLWTLMVSTVIRRSLLFLRLNKELMTLLSSVKNAFWSLTGFLTFALWTMISGGPEFRLMSPVVNPRKLRELKALALPAKSLVVEPILSYSMTLKFPLTLLPTSCVKSCCSWSLKASPSLRQKTILVSCFSVRRKLLLRFIVPLENATIVPLSGLLVSQRPYWIRRSTSPATCQRH